MSGDEIMVSAISTVIAAVLWARWYGSTTAFWPTDRRVPGRGPLWMAPLLVAVMLVAVLRTIASFDVVNDKRYIYMYLVLGLAWTGLATLCFPLLGLHLRDDAVERRNGAVGPAMAGAILGVGAAFAGGNVGDGPGWGVVVASAFMATALLGGIWFALESFTHVAESITVERDSAAGWRLGGLLAAVGLILGRSVAGDWVSAEAMLVDLARGSVPALVLLAFAAFLERHFRVSAAAPDRSASTHGVVPALLMVGMAGAWVVQLGMPQ
jgi:hypothetical protein